MSADLDIPPSLRLTVEERHAAWVGVKLSKPPPLKPAKATLTPEAKAILKEMEADQEAKRKARFEALRERRK